MTKPLDREHKALRAMARAWRLVPEEAQQRVLEWFVAYCLQLPGYKLPAIGDCPQCRQQDDKRIGA